MKLCLRGTVPRGEGAGELYNRCHLVVVTGGTWGVLRPEAPSLLFTQPESPPRGLEDSFPAKQARRGQLGVGQDRRVAHTVRAGHWQNPLQQLKCDISSDYTVSLDS